MSSDGDLIERVTRAVLERMGAAGAGAAESVRDVVEQAVAERPVVAPHGPSCGDHVTPRGAHLPWAPESSPPPVDYCTECVEQERSRARSRAILTTTGRNRRGIVARLTQAIAAAGGDILDISQTLVGEYFTMIIIIDVGHLELSFADFREKLTADCQALELQVMVMHEDVARSLQRV